MRVLMKTIYAGPNGQAGPGESIELTEAEAAALVAGGYAEAVADSAPVVEQPAAVEVAAVEQPEKAVVRRNRPRKETR